jgi:PTH1 family peptidyl-tRNA hydrolase
MGIAMRIRSLLKRGPRLKADWLVVGLGNPGPEYAGTRHNLGFRVVNELARRAGVQPRSAGGKLVAGAGILRGAPVALVKPLTYVNASGPAVARALNEAGCGIDHCIVVYDDLDLAANALRIRAGGGHGGHNGLKSIGAHNGLDFLRVRIGIGRPEMDGKPTRDPKHISDWVLGQPSRMEAEEIDETVKLAADAVETIIAEGVDSAGNRFNRR